jgi:hypothetical protein
MKKILALEARVMAAKLNALAWLHHAAYLKLEQVSLCRDGATRARAHLRLAEDIEFLRQNEGVLAACSDAFPDEVEPEMAEQKKARRWIDDGGKSESQA